jgi:hypothetical protein
MAGNATVSVNTLPNAYTVTGGGTYCAGGTGFNIGTSGSQSGVNYQLYNGTSTVGGQIAGTGAALDFGVKTSAGTYAVVATDALHGCVSNMTGAAVITVNPLPIQHNVVGGGSFCAGGTGITVSIDGSEAGVNYTLYNGTSAVGAAVAGTNLGFSFGPQTAGGNYTVMAADATTGCSATMTGIATVIVNPVPTVQTVAASGTSYCAGGTGINISLTGSQTGVNYTLYNGSTPAGAAMAGTGAAISFGNKTIAGTYSVMATDATTGCASNMTGSASVSINPLPTAFPVTGGGAICAGSAGVAVTLGGSQSGVNYTLYMSGTSVGSTSGTGSTISFGLQNAAGTYVATAANATTGCTRTMSGSAAITINALPTAYTVTGGGSYCNGSAGQHVGLNGSSTSISYQLYRDGVATGASVAGTGAALDFGIFTTIGIYSVSATNATTGCTNGMTGTATISVNALPDAYAVTGGGGYCPDAAGVAVGMANTATGINYRLYNGSTLVTTISGTGGAMSFGVQTVGVYTVSAINTATGCVKAMTGNATVSVNALPAVNTVTGGGNYCEGGAGVNVAMATTEPGVHYQLYLGATPIGAPITGVGSAMNFGMQTAAGVYTVMATNGASCSRAMAGAATVAITPAVSPTVSLALSTDNTVCAGTSVNYTATGTNGGTSPTYQWYVNTTPVTASGASYNYTPANGDVISVTMTSSAACAMPASVSESTTMIVNATHTPVVTITPDPTGAICKGLSVTFTATPDYGGTTPTYSWIKNGVFAGAGATFTMTPNDNDVVYCMMTSNYTCRTANTVTSNKDTLKVVEPTIPTVVVTTDKDITKLKAGDFVEFTASVSGAGTAPEIQWIINGNVISGATTATFTTNLLNDKDTITVRVRGNGPCGGNYNYTSLVVNMSMVGVVNVAAADIDVRVMPNPNKGDFTVKGTLGTNTSEDVRVEVTNMLGQVVYKNTVKASHGSINESISLDNTLSNGMYLLNITAGDRSKVFHVTVSR